MSRNTETIRVPALLLCGLFRHLSAYAQKHIIFKNFVQNSNLICNFAQRTNIRTYMKYSSDYINSLSFEDYLKLMAKELNENGFEEKGIGAFRVYDDPVMKRHFMMGVVDNPKALEFLRSIGLLDNGRCPTCGAPMNTGTRFCWYDRRFPNHKFSLCYGCHESRFHGDGHSLNGTTKPVPSQINSNSQATGSGCIVAFLLLPYHWLATLLSL